MDGLITPSGWETMEPRRAHGPDEKAGPAESVANSRPAHAAGAGSGKCPQAVRLGASAPPGRSDLTAPVYRSGAADDDYVSLALRSIPS